MANQETGSSPAQIALAITLLALQSAGCAGRRPDVAGTPLIPERSGALRIDVVYPPEGSTITATDSNFIFGSIGNGAARLLINGSVVDVEPNGAFLAWLPVPSAPDDTLAGYDLVATLGDRRLSKTHTVRLPSRGRAMPADSAAIATESVAPTGAWWVRSGEPVPVVVRATPGAKVRLLLPNGAALLLHEIESGVSASAANWNFGDISAGRGAGARSVGEYRGTLYARTPLGLAWTQPNLAAVPADTSIAATYCSTTAPGARVDSAAKALETGAAEGAAASERPEQAKTSTVAARLKLPVGCAVVEVALPGDTVWAPLELDLWILDEPGLVVELREADSPTLGGDGRVTGRAAPLATTTWLWTEGARARVTGRRNDSVRIALDGRTDAWVDLGEVAALPHVVLPQRARVGTVRLSGAPDRLQVRVSVSHPLPYQVEVDGARLTLVLYGAYSDTDWLQYGPAEPFLRSARWEQASSDRYLLHLELASQPWGYSVHYGPGLLALDVRKPPVIDPERPFSGRRIVVDPGHPPAGATGPTRLYEGDANLAVAYRLRRLLEEEGATVILTRGDRSIVRLYDRPYLAELQGGEILVSIHNNALPDGVNPYERHGTSVYYFQPQSLDLARAVQQGLLQHLGLRDLGLGRASLALVRPSWMPAVLTEGAFMMIPAQEAALRNPQFLEAYARGVLEGLRAFLLARAG
ncbi:MAG: N-acetylmuramoyl-L-alanine amidase [Gemmatimonadota bacterium]|nr:MAG: N-acetylmuramoyl-L-alanine amidase [Gemmatimonadota bacterium]